MGALDGEMLFEVLKSIVRSRGEAIECSTVHMAGGHMTAG